jgi:hypothetical protein
MSTISINYNLFFNNENKIQLIIFHLPYFIWLVWFDFPLAVIYRCLSETSSLQGNNCLRTDNSTIPLSLKGSHITGVR